ncbi:MAG: VOC family protein [Alphaproteobacteria bacterium]|nr:VOC family protein [Alphaproteobacteria bacterium]
MQQRLSIIALGVCDLKKSRKFYEDLGWQTATQEGAENIVAFNLQSFVLTLYPIEKLAEEVDMPIKITTPSFTLAYNVASEAEVDATIEEARNIGAKIVKPPQKVFWGGYSSYFSDPDGYLWEVAFNPFSQPEPDGAFKWV